MAAIYWSSICMNQKKFAWICTLGVFYGPSKLLLIKSSHKVGVNSLFFKRWEHSDSERFSSLEPKISMEYWNLIRCIFILKFMLITSIFFFSYSFLLHLPFQNLWHLDRGMSLLASKWIRASEGINYSNGVFTRASYFLLNDCPNLTSVPLKAVLELCNTPPRQGVIFHVAPHFQWLVV